MARAAVEHLHVHVGACPLREALEEILHQLRLQVADARDLQVEIDDRVRAAADRSIAATASVSSIGITK